LRAPGGPERSRASKIATTIANEVHNQNTELNRKLLDNGNRATLLSLGNLGKVDRNLGGGDADKVINNSTCDELAPVSTADLNGSSDQLKDAGYCNSAATTQFV
jgi:hypothetical protein